MKLERLFPNFADFDSYFQFDAAKATAEPRCNLYEDETGFTIRAEMPGVKRDNITLGVENGKLKLEGKSAATTTKAYACEFYEESKFARTFRVGDGVDLDNIKAELLDGILTVTLPKSEKTKPRKITVL